MTKDSPALTRFAFLMFGVHQFQVMSGIDKSCDCYHGQNSAKHLQHIRTFQTEICPTPIDRRREPRILSFVFDFKNVLSSRGGGLPTTVALIVARSRRRICSERQSQIKGRANKAARTQTKKPLSAQNKKISRKRSSPGM